MPFKSFKPRRNSLRWQGHDYSDPGDYFVTICTHQRELWLSEIVNSQVVPSPLGKIVTLDWGLMPTRFPYVVLGAFVLMPNHLHGLLQLTDRTDATPRQGVSDIIRWFKGLSARYINDHRGTYGAPVWQRSFYDSVIKHPRMYDHIHQYILENPLKWELDRLHPHHPNPFPTLHE